MTAQGDAEASHMQGCLRTPYIRGHFRKRKIKHVKPIDVTA